MTVSYRVHLLRLIYVHGAGKYPAGWIEMRQAASIQGDLGRSPASACRPRPWWTCSHGEVIHDVTAVSCRWRADRGPKRAWLSFPVFFFFSFRACVCSHTEVRWLTDARETIFIAVRFAVWLNVYTVVGRLFFFPVGQVPTYRCRPTCDVLFFPGIFKVEVMSLKFLIYFHFIDGDRQFSSLKLLAVE